MAVLTAIERATISGYVDTMQSYGFDLAVIDGHVGSCPICQAWEGVIISVSGHNPDYPSLGDAESAGCFHPRCLHGITTYYEGISNEPAGGFRDQPREIKPASPQYTARSMQRYMERMIRKYKDRAIVAQTPQQKAQALGKVREWEEALDELIEKQPKGNYLYRHHSREGTYGFVKPKSKLTGTTPSGSIEALKPPLSFDDKQFGKKIGKHAMDYGLDPGKAADREVMKGIITDIHDHADFSFPGEWRGYGKVIFYEKNVDIVITEPDGSFIKIMKGGADNERGKNQRGR